jgi:hypothetical protein
VRGDILRELGALESFRRERETRRALDDEMANVRRRLGRQHTLDWANAADRVAAERAAERAAEALHAAMEDEEAFASVGFGQEDLPAATGRW